MPVDSALARELSPKIAIWSSQAKTNAILADLFDILAMINANLVASITRKPAKKPNLYKRPVDAEKTKKVGNKSAMPHDEMAAWIEQKRADHAKRNSSNNGGEE